MTSTDPTVVPPAILLVEDEPLSQRAIRRVLSRQGYRVDVADTAAEALDILGNNQYDVVLVDIVLPDLLGHELVQQARSLQPEATYLGISGQGSSTIVERILAAGATDYFDKQDLQHARFHTVLQQHTSRTRPPRPRVHVEDPDPAFGRLLGHSAAMVSLRSTIRTVARFHHVDLLICGASGTGKERVAEAIHRASGLRGPLVIRSAADIPESLADSELRGHVAGAFTGAHRDRQGLLGRASDGTLFIDEVQDLSPAVQRKFLRLLETRRYDAVGGARTRTFQGRFVFATNVDLRERVADGSFRHDLFHRLWKFPIHVPTLAERREDIPRLFWAFLDAFNDQAPVQVHKVAPSVMGHLLRFGWADNHVRQLRNTAEYAALRAVVDFERAGSKGEPVIRPEHLPEEVRPELPPMPQELAASTSGTDFVFPADLSILDRSDAKARTVQAFDRWYLRSLLESHDYNITRAADAAGMQRTNFRRQMVRAGVEVPKVE